MFAIIRFILLWTVKIILSNAYFYRHSKNYLITGEMHKGVYNTSGRT